MGTDGIWMLGWRDEKRVMMCKVAQDGDEK